jgi:osomolarity two-component system response regulator SKN7
LIDQQPKIEDIKNLPVVSSTSSSSTSPGWTDQSTIPIESILTDLFLPTPSSTTNTTIDTATVAAAAAQLNGGSLIGSSIKTSDGGGLTFLALGRLASNMNNQKSDENQNSNNSNNSNNEDTNNNTIKINTQQQDHVSPSETDKGKKKMVASWTTPPRVLLVDDDSVYRDVSGRMLNMIGCSIDLAKDGLEALQKMSAEKYDLILMVRKKNIQFKKYISYL